MEFWLHDELVMVAVCDQLDDGISAVYNFYDPDATINSLGHPLRYLPKLIMLNVLTTLFIFRFLGTRFG